MATTDDAWKIHDAVVAWTSNVDSKASFALAIESGVVAGVIALAGDNRRLSHLSGCWAEAAFWAGIVCLVFGLLLVAAVVTPQIRSSETKTEWGHRFIFFGHLRHWNEEDLTIALKERDILPVLSHQLVVMSKIAWRKHRLLQGSMVLAIAGSALVGVAAALNS